MLKRSLVQLLLCNLIPYIGYVHYEKRYAISAQSVSANLGKYSEIHYQEIQIIFRTKYIHTQKNRQQLH